MTIENRGGRPTTPTRRSDSVARTYQNNRDGGDYFLFICGDCNFIARSVKGLQPNNLTFCEKVCLSRSDEHQVLNCYLNSKGQSVH